MKRFLIFYLIPLLCFSCKKDTNQQIMPELVISTESVGFSNAGETKSIHIKSNVNWSVTSSESWLTLSVSNGTGGTTKIDIIAAANSQVTERKATLTVTAGSLTKSVNVLQSASSLFSVDKTDVIINNDAQEIQIKVQSNAAYEVSFGGDWLSRKSDPINSGTTYSETMVVKRNGNIFDRESAITFKKGSEIIVVKVKQAANFKNIPASNTGVDSDAPALASKMKLGWNLGNSLEAASSSTSASEILWGNPKTTKGLIDAVKSAGFNAVRIPCAWSGYIEDQATYKIKDSWLERVKEVVDYCVANDMYAVINIHWDGGWLEENPTYTAQEAVNKKQRALWEQIAVYFRDYDEHLLFAGTNEVHKDYGTPSAENIAVQQSFNQTFVDAVRATGGKNTYRNLVVQSYNTNIDHAVKLMTMPADPATKRLMAEVHFYDPYEFALDDKSDKYLWGKDFIGSPNIANWGQEAWVDQQFANMKTKFVNAGIPVILGEYGAILRTTAPNLANHNKARNYYLTYVTKAAKSNGLIPFYWDNGGTGNNSFGLFDRATRQVVHQDAINAIMEGGK